MEFDAEFNIHIKKMFDLQSKDENIVHSSKMLFHQLIFFLTV